MFMAFIFSDSSPGLFDIGISMFGGIFLSLGVIALLYGGIQIYRAHESADWPQTQGQIVYNKVDTTQSKTTDDTRSSVTTSYGAHLIFQYSVAGRTYFSNLRNFGQLAAADEEWATELASSCLSGCLS
jgi:hypothetical protein